MTIGLETKRCTEKAGATVRIQSAEEGALWQVRAQKQFWSLFQGLYLFKEKILKDIFMGSFVGEISNIEEKKIGSGLEDNRKSAKYFH